MKPTYKLTDPRFQYVPAAKTDIRKTFARILRQQRIERATQPTNVSHLMRKAK